MITCINKPTLNTPQFKLRSVIQGLIYTAVSHQGPIHSYIIIWLQLLGNVTSSFFNIHADVETELTQVCTKAIQGKILQLGNLSNMVVVCVGHYWGSSDAEWTNSSGSECGDTIHTVIQKHYIHNNTRLYLALDRSTESLFPSVSPQAQYQTFFPKLFLLIRYFLIYKLNHNGNECVPAASASPLQIKSVLALWLCDPSSRVPYKLRKIHKSWVHRSPRRQRSKYVTTRNIREPSSHPSPTQESTQLQGGFVNLSPSERHKPNFSLEGNTWW